MLVKSRARICIFTLVTQHAVRDAAIIEMEVANVSFYDFMSSLLCRLYLTMHNYKNFAFLDN